MMTTKVFRLNGYDNDDDDNDLYGNYAFSLDDFLFISFFLNTRQ